MTKHRTSKPNDAATLGGKLLSTHTTQRLLEELRTGCFAGASQLPPELELAEQLGVSRTVLRDVLGELERDGCIERVRGIGTVINRPVVMTPDRLDHKLEFNQMIRSVGCDPVCDNVLITKEQPSDKVAKQLALPPGPHSTVLVVRKRILADNKPVVYCIDTMPLQLFEGHKLERIDFSRPVFDVLREEFGMEVTKTLTHLRATPGPAVIRRLLSLGGADALLELNEVCYTRRCQPVVSAQTYYTDFYDFAMVRTLVEPV